MSHLLRSDRAPSPQRLRNRQHLRDRRKLRLESLERRAMLAGNIQASVIGSKLFLTGDNLDNNVAVVSLGAGRYAVAGIGTTVNGGPGVFVTPRPVAHLSANLQGGNDGLGLGNSAVALFDLADQLFLDLEDQLGVDAATLQLLIDAATTVDDFSLSGSLTVVGGAGDDVVAVIGNIGGSVVVSLGTASEMGANAFGMDGQSLTGGRGTVGGSLSVVGDGQADGVFIANTQVRGSVSASLGSGRNDFGLTSSSVAGGLSVVGGANNDFVSLDFSTISGHVGVVLGNGEVNSLTLGSGVTEDERLRVGSLSMTGGLGNEQFLGAFTAQRSVSIWTGAGRDLVTLAGQVTGPTMIRGSLSVDTGTGDDVVSMQATIGQSMVLTLGQGNDQFEGLMLVVGFNATIDAGEGNDELLIAQSDFGQFLYVFLGAGDDALQLMESDARAVYLFGGVGNDELDVDAETLAAVDFLFRTEFES